MRQACVPSARTNELPIRQRIAQTMWERQTHELDTTTQVHAIATGPSPYPFKDRAPHLPQRQLENAAEHKRKTRVNEAATQGRGERRMEARAPTEAHASQAGQSKRCGPHTALPIAPQGDPKQAQNDARLARPVPGRTRLSSSWFRRHPDVLRPTFGRLRPELGRGRPSSRWIRTNLSWHRPTVGPCRPDLGRSPTLGGVDQTGSRRSRPDISSFRLRGGVLDLSITSRFRRLHAKFDRNRPTLAH